MSKIATGSLRRLTALDQPLFEDHLLRLDLASRRNRFGGAVSEFFLRDYARRAFALDGAIYGYVEDGVLRAAGELRILTDDVEREAEAAFSVEPDWRRRSLATRLFQRIVDAARNRGVGRIMVVCLPENAAMRGLIKKFGGKILRLAPDALGVVPAPRANFFSRWREAVNDTVGFAAAMFDIGRGAGPRREPAKRGREERISASM